MWLDAERKLSGAGLSTLAEQMVKTTDPVEASRARESIVRGFYGTQRNGYDDTD